MHADTTFAAVERPLAPSPRLVPSVRAALRLRRYSLKTERAYVHWVKRYVRFHALRHPTLSLWLPRLMQQ